jgi:hypothetical protein
MKIKKTDYLAALDAFLSGNIAAASNAGDGDDGDWADEEPTAALKPKPAKAGDSAGKLPAPAAGSSGNGYSRAHLLEMLKRGDEGVKEYMQAHREQISKDLLDCIED